MAALPTTALETHPVGTAGINGVINGNWDTLEAIFEPLGSAVAGHSIQWDAGLKKFALRPGPQTLVDAASIAWNLAAGDIATVTLGDNRTLANPTNPRAGTFILKVVQDGTGSRTLALDTNYRTQGGAGVTLSTAAGAIDILTFVNFGDGVFHCVPALDFQA